MAQVQKVVNVHSSSHIQSIADELKQTFEMKDTGVPEVSNGETTGPQSSS